MFEISTSPDGLTDVARFPEEPTRIFPSVSVVVCFPVNCAWINDVTSARKSNSVDVTPPPPN